MDEHSVWRYDAALPIKQADAVAYFGEGMTPLLPSRRQDTPFLFKLETLFPSGSFKDRGSAVWQTLQVRRPRCRRGLVRATPGLAGSTPPEPT
jgi:threonine synthase